MIRNFCSKLADYNYRVLWAEAVVLSVIIGAGLASWPGVIVLLAVLTWVLDRKQGKVLLIGLFSLTWGLLAGMIGFGLGGWAWALLLGSLALISGVKIHCRDLKRPFVQAYNDFKMLNAKELRESWIIGRQNLN
ncbi:MAG: hypothetical protein KGJ09_03550 [Candidatus Omnitrophica bacterium]|nr:hypothetical protein [Candidatus Omnitrophota bacterium]